MIVGVVTQPMRVRYCAAHLGALITSERRVVVVPDENHLLDVQIPDGVESIVSGARFVPSPSERIARGRVRTVLAERAADGSSVARFIELLARRAMWSMRYLDRGAIVARSATGRLKPEIVSTSLSDELERLDDQEPITQLLCFDVFDVPTAVEFARNRSTSVLVR